MAEVVDDEVFNRVVNGTADDAVLSDVFGLDTTSSPASAELRAEVAELEARAMTGTIGAEDIARLKDLQAKLPTSQAELARRGADAVPGRSAADAAAPTGTY